MKMRGLSGGNGGANVEDVASLCIRRCSRRSKLTLESQCLRYCGGGVLRSGEDAALLSALPYLYSLSSSSACRWVSSMTASFSSFCGC